MGIIGVVAALTIPTLISSYKKLIVETRLKSFYTTINEAINLSEIDNGSREEWQIRPLKNFYNNYLDKYLKTTKVDIIDDNTVIFYLINGTAVKMFIAGEEGVMPHLEFYLNGNNIDNTAIQGKDYFVFLFLPKNGKNLSRNLYCNSPYGGDSGVTPYFWFTGEDDYWDYEKNCRFVVWPTEQEINNVLLNKPTYGCAEQGAYCTKLIQRNGWKIPDDYPIKF